MAELMGPLANAGFERVDTTANGAWTTDGTHTLQVNTEMTMGHPGPHTVVVYEGQPDELDVTTGPVAEVTHNNATLAVERALEQVSATADS